MVTYLSREERLTYLVSQSFFFGMVGAMVGFYLWSIRWVYVDARARDKPGTAVAWLVALTGPVGLLFWLVARPGY